jgi:hypothetical protein
MLVRISFAVGSLLLLVLHSDIVAKELLPSPKFSASAADKADALSGDWNALFEVEGNKVPVKFKFKLNGQQVTGTADSDHTGPGTLSNGTFAANKISFTMVFARHESIDVTGKLEARKLFGEFSTEGRKGTWTAEPAPGANAQ